MSYSQATAGQPDTCGFPRHGLSNSEPRSSPSSSEETERGHGLRRGPPQNRTISTPERLIVSRGLTETRGQTETKKPGDKKSGVKRDISPVLRKLRRPGSTIGQGVGSRDHASSHQSSTQGSHSTRPSRSPELCRPDLSRQ